MNLEQIQIHLPDRTVQVPNRWELLTPKLYLYVCRLLTEYAAGNISFRELHAMYVCHSLGLEAGKLTDETACQNLYVISSQVDFIFEKPGKLNSMFLAQLVPLIRIPGHAKGRLLRGYRVNTTFDTLSCSLTAIQYIEAYELIGCKKDKLPLMAAILYFPAPYNSEAAHELAGKLTGLEPVLLEAISLNFLAFSNYLFCRTHFSLLRGNPSQKEKSGITVGMADSLYDLSGEGFGDVSAVEQMPVIKYLTLLRKKLIESVKAMRDAEIELFEIAEKTGLTIKQIKQII
jgi:hypothetical protein